MKYVPVILEEVAQKYCKPGEHIVHEYYIEPLRLDGKITAYRSSLYTEDGDFLCARFSTLEEAVEWKEEFNRVFPGLNLKVAALTDDEIYQLSIACLKRN